MSAFVGVVHLYGERPDRSYLEGMAGYLSRIGPDSQAIRVEGEVGMVHALLRTSDSGAAHKQPLDNGRYLVVGDVRLDDRKTLVRHMKADSDEYASDIELAFRAWLTWGDEVLQHLRGDFSLAIWDKLERRLYCLRDQMGVKQFFYARKNGVLVFSNVLNCLRQYPGIGAALNDQAVVDFLVFGFNLEFTSTIFADIQRLAPAHSLEVSSQATCVRRRWSLPLDGQLRYRRDTDYVEHFRERLRESVADRLCAGPMAVSMSGGLDSTTVAAYAHQALSPAGSLSLYTLDIQSLWPEDREAEYAAKVAQKLGAPLHVQPIAREDLFATALDSGWLLPEPSRDSFHAAIMAVFRQIARGQRVGLTGHGADPLLMPTQDYFGAMLREGKWRRLLLEAVRFYRVHGHRPPLRLRGAIKRKYERAPFRPVLPRWLRPEVKARTAIEERFMARLEAASSAAHPLHPQRPEAYLDITSPIWPATLARFDAQTTGLPLEFRHPYLDLRLVESVLAMPPSPWFYNKALLRGAAAGLLPECVRLRHKAMPRISPVYKGLLAAGQAEPESWLHGSDAMAGYVDVKELENLLGSSDRMKPGESDQVALPVAFAGWLRLNRI